MDIKEPIRTANHNRMCALVILRLVLYSLRLNMSNRLNNPKLCNLHNIIHVLRFPKFQSVFK